MQGSLVVILPKLRYNHWKKSLLVLLKQKALPSVCLLPWLGKLNKLIMDLTVIINSYFVFQYTSRKIKDVLNNMLKKPEMRWTITKPVFIYFKEENFVIRDIYGYFRILGHTDVIENVSIILLYIKVIKTKIGSWHTEFSTSTKLRA